MTYAMRPTTLDGAALLRSADLSGLQVSGRLMVVTHGEAVRATVNLAICQYESASDCYLFFCSAGWFVLAAGHYESVNAAEHAAERAFPGVSRRWAARG